MREEDVEGRERVKHPARSAGLLAERLPNPVSAASISPIIPSACILPTSVFGHVSGFSTNTILENPRRGYRCNSWYRDILSNRLGDSTLCRVLKLELGASRCNCEGLHRLI